MTDNPSITALMLTRNRRTWLSTAIECWMRQTYENRRLLVLADGDDVGDLVPADPRVSLVQLTDDQRPRTIGEKRNLGCSMIDTELICSWDDDDYNAPTRIADQVLRLVESGNQVTGYRILPFKDGQDWWLYTGVPGWAAGTSLCFRREWWEKHPFPRMEIGEDNEFVQVAFNSKVLVTADGSDFQYASIWMGNTSKKCMTGPTWKRIEAPTQFDHSVAA